MNVLHVSTTISRGGAEKQLLTLVEQQVKQGMRVSVAYLKGNAELRDDFNRVGAIVIDDLAVKKFIGQIVRVRKLTCKGVDVVHAHLPRAELVCLMAKADSVFIVSRHNAEQFYPSGTKIFSKILSRIVLHQANATIAISKAVCNFLIESGESPNSSKLKIVHYGFDPNINFRPPRINLSQNAHRFGTISRLTPQKDLTTLIRAFSIFSSRHRNSILSIAGVGYLLPELVALVENLHLEERVHFIGKIIDVPSFLESLDTFVLSSKYEGFGLVLLEALQAGLPIIATNNSAIPEVLGANYMGLYKTGNIEELLEKMEIFDCEENRIKAIGELSRRIERFTPEHMAHKILRVYESAIQGHQ